MRYGTWIFLLWLLPPMAVVQGEEVQGYVVPLMHQDIGYTDAGMVTLDKMARCLLTVAPELEEHPDWSFWWEYAYTLKCVLETHPELKPRVKRLLQRGQLGVGAEWAGMDATLVPGESLVRTVTLAKQWLMRELDYEPTVASMNDMAGFGPQMGQVYAKAGVEFFFYTRGWEPPKGNYFYCVGLDGSKVLASKATTPKEIKGVEDVGYDGYAMFSGLGMFVGGEYKWEPTEVEVQQARRELVLLNQALDEKEWPGGIFWGMLNGGGDNRCPKLATVQENIAKWNQANDPLTRQVRFQFGPMDKISRQIQRAVANDTLENWIFYFQPWPVQMRQERTFYYLSQAESNLLTAEKLACLVEILGLEKFPTSELQMIWGDKLLWVYEHNWGGKEDRGGSDREKKSAAYEAMRHSQVLLESKLQTLASAVQYQQPNPVIVFNPMNWRRSDVVTARMDLPAGQYVVTDSQGTPVNGFQREVGEGAFGQKKEYEISFLSENVPSVGYRTYYIASGPMKSKESKVRVEKDQIENEYFRIALNPEKGIWSIWDKKRKRELLRKGYRRWFGQVVSEDVRNQPKGELDGDPVLDGVTAQDFLRIIQIQTASWGTLGAQAVIQGEIEQSPVKITIQLWAGLRRMDFAVEMDYQGSAPRVLYVCLPLEVGKEVQNTIGLSYGAMVNREMKGSKASRERIQADGFSAGSRFAEGYIGAGWTDPTTARFAQKWTDVSTADGDEGVTLVLRYNHTPIYWKHNSLFLGLLRSLTRHDADKAKKGYHQVAFSLVPHKGDWKASRAYRQGWEGSNPLAAMVVSKAMRSCGKGFLPEQKSFIQTNQDNFILSVLTKSEDNQNYIVRGYEAEDRKATVHFEMDSSLSCNQAEIVDLLERGMKDIAVINNGIQLDVGGFEVATVKIDIENK